MKYRVKSFEYVTAIQMPVEFNTFQLSTAIYNKDKQYTDIYEVDVEPGDWIVSFDDRVEVWTDEDFKKDFEKFVDPADFKDLLEKYKGSPIFITASHLYRNNVFHQVYHRMNLQSMVLLYNFYL